MKLDDVVVGNFAMAKVYRENTERINSLDFNREGTLLVSSSDDDSIIIFDCNNGTKKRSVNSKKYGVDLIRFTHADNTAVHCSRKVDDTIRYLSLHDNKYIRYFPGHTKQVVTLCMSPLDDTFLSGSIDKTLRLWDLRSNNCQGLMTVPGHPVAAFDPEGVIFAAGINSQHVKLYDLRSFDKGPFVTFKLDQEKDCDWTELTFSPDGKMILIQTNGTILRVIDAYQGNLLYTLTGHQNAQCKPLSGSFSPDSRYVFCGSSDQQIYAWNVDQSAGGAAQGATSRHGPGGLVRHFSGEHTGTVQHAKFNPKYMMLASACSTLSFWIPQIADED